MITTKTKLAALAASLLALVTTASAADMSSVKISGYVAASYQYQKTSGLASNSNLFKGATAALGSFVSSSDRARIALSAESGQVSGIVSLYYIPNAATELSVFDASVTYKVDSNWSVTAGNYYGPFGYEPFDAPAMTAITYGNAASALIPTNYHTGVRLDYTDKDWSANIAVVDSIYNTAAANKGDGELKANKGIEASFTYTALKDWTLFAALGYQDQGGAAATGSATQSITLVDIWAKYNLTADATAALEYVNTSNSANSGLSASQWLATVNYAFNKDVSAAFRVGVNNGVGANTRTVQYTIAPTFKVSGNLSVIAEFSRINAPGALPSQTYVGLGGVLSF